MVISGKFLQRRWILLISLIVLLLDFITKHIIRVYEPNLILLPFFSLTYITNTGGAFGIFGRFPWLFIMSAIIVVCVIAYFYTRIPQKPVYIISIGLILAGTVGNLIDRILFGQVTDFIAFSFWPAFNIADSALCIGMVCLAIVLWKEDIQDIKAKKAKKAKKITKK